MKGSRVVVATALGLSLFLLPLLMSFAAEPAKILKIGNTVALKTKEGIQIKKWLELLAERQNAAGGIVVKGQRYNIQPISLRRRSTRGRRTGLLRRGSFTRTR